MFLILVGKLQPDLSVLDKDIIVDDLVKGLGTRSQTQIVQLELGRTQFIVFQGIVIHDFHPQHHVVEGGNFEPKGLAIFGAGVVVLGGGFLASVVLVHDHVVLLEIKFDVSVECINII
jgi:predicted cation transporter